MKSIIYTRICHTLLSQHVSHGIYGVKTRGLEKGSPSKQGIYFQAGFGRDPGRGYGGRVVLKAASLHEESGLGTRGTIPGTVGIPGKTGAPGILNELDGCSCIGVAHTGCLTQQREGGVLDKG
jgi:hypothetical protein